MSDFSFKDGENKVRVEAAVFSIDNGFGASSSPRSSIKQKVGRMISPCVFFKLSKIENILRQNTKFHFFRREKQLSSKVIIHEGTDDIYK